MGSRSSAQRSTSVLDAALGHGGEGFRSEAWPLPALEPARTTLIGVRSLDEGERSLWGELDVAVHTMSEVDRRGIEPLVADALERAAGAAFVHVSLDMDALDPEVAPGVGTAVRGGLTYREAHLAMELVAESGWSCGLRSAGAAGGRRPRHRNAGGVVTDDEIRSLSISQRLLGTEEIILIQNDGRARPRQSVRAPDA